MSAAQTADETGAHPGTVTGATWIAGGLTDQGDGCFNTPIVCDDGVGCTVDACNPADGTCQYTATDALCDDGVACTIDSCDDVDGCTNALDDGLCDDSNSCTGDVCVANAAAVSFDGSNDSIEFGPTTAFAGASVTVEGWFKTDNPDQAGYRSIFRHGRQGPFPQFTVEMVGGRHSRVHRGHGRTLAVHDGRGGHGQRMAPLRSSGRCRSSPSVTSTWTESSDKAGPWALVGPADSTDNVVIGAARLSGGTLGGYFRGEIDEVRVWDHARTLTEINDNMNLEIPTATGLVSRWGLNEDFGSSITSDSAGTNDGTLNGATWILNNLVHLGGSCDNAPVADGVSCDEGDVCLVDATCQSGACLNGTAPDLLGCRWHL